MKRVAVIGCGAIADSFHVPALKEVLGDGADLVLVDPDAERAGALARKYGIRETATSHTDVAEGLDAAVVASPHHTHVPIATELVEAGVAVLSEKPLGTSRSEVEGLRDLARERGVVVAVNQTRRFIPAAQEVGRILKAGELGTPVEVRVSEGDKFDWPAATPSMFGARSGGRGLLLDIGAHVLDLMVWWLGPDLEVEDYRDDSFGGSEASVLAALRSDTASVTIRLSWLAKQRNEYVLSGPKGTVRWGVYDQDRVTMEDRAGRPTTRKLAGAPRNFAGLGPRVVQDFFQAIDGAGPPMAGPDDVLPSMRLMDTCYERRARFDLPWHDFSLEAAHGG